MPINSISNYGSFIDGSLEDISSGIDTFTVYNPSDGEKIAEVAEGGHPAVNRAITAAKKGQQRWQEMGGPGRGEILYQIAEQISENEKELAEIRTAESGRPLSECKMNIGQLAPSYYKYYAGLADKIEGETIPVPGNRLSFTTREPYGVTGHIVPWNAPVVLASRSIAPALAAGNSVVIKPSPEAPISLLELGKRMNEAGVPPGVVNVVCGDGARTGEALTNNNQIDHLTFTGSRETGTTVIQNTAENIIPVEAELGGKSPSIVFPDADLEQAAEETRNVFTNAGQICFACTRLFIHKDIYDGFLRRVVEKTERLTVGPGENDPDIGPLISMEARDRVETLVSQALEQGARLLTGGEIPADDGAFYEPTIVDNVSDDAPISCQEVFGPVLTAYKFDTVDEVVERANDTEYGLYASVWTDDVKRARRLSTELESGGVSVNEYPVPMVQLPFGGYKESGLGRQQGKQAIEKYTQTKSVTFAG